MHVRPPQPSRLRAALLISALLCACSDDPSDPVDTTDASDTASDVVETDAADVAEDTADDADEDAQSDDAQSDAADDAQSDAAPDATEPDCTGDETECSDDGFILRTCADGAWVETACMADSGLLCEDGACVSPYTWNSPEWGTCPDAPRDTGTSLADKAAYYDELAQRLHVHPDLGWMMTARLNVVEVECAEGETAPCFEHDPPLADATYDDVVAWSSGANDGLWSALYLTSQIFRYATTGEEEALEMVRLMMQSQRRRMDIAGVPGMYVRIMRPPDMPSLPCPSDPMDYVVDVEKDDDRWVQISDDGCASTYDPVAEAFVESDHCGLDDYAGWCFLDNVSQDEYAGHMLVLGAIDTMIDDPEIRELAAGMAGEVADYMIDNDLTFVDWDGRVTEHGILYAYSLVDSPGFLSAQALSWFKVAANLTGRADIQEFYDECLLQRSGNGRCLPWPTETGRPYHTDSLPLMTLYVGPDACTTNFNRTSMVMSNMWLLLNAEHDPEVRAVAQRVLDEEVFHDESSRSLSVQGNPWYNFIWASSRSLGGVDDEQALAEVEAGICSLRAFPDDKIQRGVDVSGYERHCESRLGDDATLEVLDVADRCHGTFLWWRSPFSIRGCTENFGQIHMPADYLLSYWMGRYYGYISETL